jgi:hypothetical protein
VPQRPRFSAPELFAAAAPDRWPSLPAGDPMIISRPASAEAWSPEPRPYRMFRPTGGPAWPADPQPTVATVELRSSESAGPWPDLPDDEALWQAPEPERSAERIRRLDAEQRGA